MLEGRCHSIELPLKLETIHMLSKQQWLLTERETERKYILSETPERVMEYTLQPIQEIWKKEFGQGLYLRLKAKRLLLILTGHVRSDEYSDRNTIRSNSLTIY